MNHEEHKGHEAKDSKLNQLRGSSCPSWFKTTPN